MDSFAKSLPACFAATSMLLAAILAATIVLMLVVVAIAWSGYYSMLWLPVLTYAFTQVVLGAMLAGTGTAFFGIITVACGLMIMLQLLMIRYDLHPGWALMFFGIAHLTLGSSIVVGLVDGRLCPSGWDQRTVNDFYIMICALLGPVYFGMSTAWLTLAPERVHCTC